jgi:hypothetical protein
LPVLGIAHCGDSALNSRTPTNRYALNVVSRRDSERCVSNLLRQKYPPGISASRKRPLTPTLSPRSGEREFGARHDHGDAILTTVSDTVTWSESSRPVKDALPEAYRRAGRGRFPRADLHSAPGRFGHHVIRHYDRGGRCFPGLGQAKAGNTRSNCARSPPPGWGGLLRTERSDRVPGNLA